MFLGYRGLLCAGSDCFSLLAVTVRHGEESVCLLAVIELYQGTTGGTRTRDPRGSLGVI